MAENVSVLVVDDHHVVRKGLISLLSSPKYGIDVIGEAEDGDAAISAYKELHPDVILMDLLMPGKNGIETTRVICQQDPRARILILTSSGEETMVRQALRAGAIGYLLKDASPDELVNAVHSVYYDQISLPQNLAQKVMLSREDADEEPDGVLLTARELDVVECIAQGMSNKQIALTLSISTTTVRTHVSSILRKLSLENRTQIALYARGDKG